MNAKIIKHELWRKLEASTGFSADDSMKYQPDDKTIAILEKDKNEENHEDHDHVLELIEKLNGDGKGATWPFPM